ncbi:MAG: hypothetical protein ABWY63_14215 [Hyphomicrobiaceae bacterium]
MSDDVKVFIETPTGTIDASKTTLPESGRKFRDAWRLEGQVIAVDMDKAREIAREQIRREREPIFHSLDVQYQRTTETRGDESGIIAKKQALRDATADPAIDEAEDDVALAETVDDIVAWMKTL